jgi:hypothetical protein
MAIALASLKTERLSHYKMNSTWEALCPPAKIYPVVMAGVVLFNLYRGTYHYAVQHAVALIIGTIFLWVLCAARLEFAAYGLLLMPVLFFVFLLAVIFYDQTLFTIKSKYKCDSGCEDTNGCC